MLPPKTGRTASSHHKSALAGIICWMLLLVACVGTPSVGLAQPCGDIDFNNDGLSPDSQDLDDFRGVLAGGACPTGNCDTTDFNRDGIFPDAADLDAFVRVLAGGGCRTHLGLDGWTVHEVAPDARTVYISASGDDLNVGDSPATPIKTFGRAYQLARDGFPDQILLRAGDVFENTSIANGYGGWDKAGRSKDEPMVFGVYGDGPRPTVSVRDGAHGLLIMGNDVWNGNIAIVGLHFVNDRPDPDKGGVGVRMFGTGGNVLLEDCLFERFTGNVSIESSINNDSSPSNWIRNVVVRRCVLVDAYSGTGHSQGIYASMVDGLTIDECVLDHNGWSETIPGKISTIYNHNAYIQPSCTNVLVTRTLTSRAAATGIQLRGRVSNAVGNLAVDNAIGITGGHGQMRWPEQAWAGTIAGNVVIGGRDVGSDGVEGREPRGFALGVGGSIGGHVTGNLVLSLKGRARCGLWLTQIGSSPNRNWTIAGNTVYDVDARYVLDHRPSPQSPPIGVNTLVTSASPAWLDARRSIESYLSSIGRTGSQADYIEACRARPRRTWDARLAPASVVQYMRAGYGVSMPDAGER
jgi:hypothetical protein